MTVPQPLRLQRYAAVLARWTLVAFVGFVLTVLASRYILNHLFHKVYRATAQIQILPQGVAGTEAPAPGSSSTPFQAEFDTMRSSDVLTPIIASLQSEKTRDQREYKSPMETLTPQDAMASLNSRLELRCVRGSNIIDIRVSSAVPKEAADIANAIADRYKALRDAAEERALRGENTLPRQLQPSPVRILSRAEIPTEPYRPNRRIDFLITLAVAVFVSVTLASFVEIVLLFLRAAEAG